MSSPHCQHIVEELRSIASFMQQRRGLQKNGGADPTAGVAARLAANIVEMINKLPQLSTMDAKFITEALSTSGFGEEHADTVVKAVDERLIAPSSAADTCTPPMPK